MAEPKTIIFIISVIIWMSTLSAANQNSSKYEYSIINTEHTAIFCCPHQGEIFLYENLSCVESTNNGQVSNLNKFGHHLRRSCVQTSDRNNSFLPGTLIEAPKDLACTSPVVQPVNKSDSANTTQSNTTNSTISFLFCESIFEQTTIRKITAIIMLSSVPFIILTMIMSKIVFPHSNALHTKSVFCYLSTLSVAFLTHSIENLGYQFPAVPCMILGYTTYFSFLASYCWLSVISFNICYNLDKSTLVHSISSTFLLCSLFCWGLPTLMLGIMWYSQRATWIGDEYKPVIGKPNYCWFSREKYGKIIFFCTERIILLSFNILMFILTIWKVYKRYIIFNRVPPFTNAIKYSCLNYGLFARIFMLMGLSWTVEMIACFFSQNDIFDYLFIFIAIQGYLIFILFITKQESRGYLKRWYSKLHNSRSEGDVVFKNVEII